MTFDEIVSLARACTGVVILPGDADTEGRAFARSMLESAAKLVCRCCSEGSRPTWDPVTRNYRHADIHDYECGATKIWRVLEDAT